MVKLDDIDVENDFTVRGEKNSSNFDSWFN
jgi:hypothetical protein